MMMPDCNLVTDCICKTRGCGDRHYSGCSDQNALQPAGFIITCAEHRDINYEKYRVEIDENHVRLDDWVAQLDKASD